MKKKIYSPARLLLLGLSGAILWWLFAPGEDKHIAAQIHPASQIVNPFVPGTGQTLPTATASTASSVAVTTPSKTSPDDPFKAFLAAHPNGEGNVTTTPPNATPGVDPFQQAMERTRQPVTTISPFNTVKTH